MLIHSPKETFELTLQIKTNQFEQQQQYNIKLYEIRWTIN